jgi:hypothetical protein
VYNPVVIELDWRLWIDILSAGFCVVGVLLALVQRRKAQEATQAEQRMRDRLWHRSAAEDFKSLSEHAGRVLLKVRSQDWLMAGELASELTRLLAQASGSWYALLRGLERDKLQTAGKYAERLLRRIPVREEQMAGGTLDEMTAYCHFLQTVSAEISGRMRIEADKG